MPKLPVVSGNDLIKVFKKIGFVIVSQKGSHIKMKNNDGGIIPQRGVCDFPRHGDVGTPQCAFPISWFCEPYNVRWQSLRDGGDHDFRIVRECCELFQPKIVILDKVLVIVKGQLRDYYNV